MKLSELYLNRLLYRDTNQDLETKDSSFVSADSSEDEPVPIASGGAAQDINTGNTQIDGGQIEDGTLPDPTLDVANWGWGQTCAFSSTDADTVSWGAGTFTSASGDAYSITGGNTGNMTAKTYIYLDLNVSSTAYQITTTSANAVGVGKVLIGVAEDDPTAATYFLSEAVQVVADNIISNTIDATKMNVGILSAITANLGTITAGSISVVSGGNTIGFTPGGVNAIFSGTTGSPQFKVTPAGALTATGATISGAVTITGGSGLANLSDAGDLALLDEAGASDLDTTVISGGKIITGLLTASNIQTGTLNASVVTVSNINASNINTGTLSAIDVQSGSGNERILLDNGDYIRYYASNVLRASVRGTTLGSGGLYQTGGDYFLDNNRSYWIGDTTGGTTKYGGISVTSGNDFWLTMGTDNQFYIYNNAQTATYFTVSATQTWIDNFVELSTESSNPTSTTGAIWHFSNASDQFRGVPTGSTVYSFDMTVV